MRNCNDPAPIAERRQGEARGRRDGTVADIRFLAHQLLPSFGAEGGQGEWRRTGAPLSTKHDAEAPVPQNVHARADAEALRRRTALAGDRKHSAPRRNMAAGEGTAAAEAAAGHTVVQALQALQAWGIDAAADAHQPTRQRAQ